jgi:hypothetical protein
MSFVDIETRVLSLQTLMQVTAESSSSDELNQLGADLGLAGSFPETQDNRAFDRTILEVIHESAGVDNQSRNHPPTGYLLHNCHFPIEIPYVS